MAPLGWLVVTVLAGIIIATPLLTIWSINTLFGAEIPFTFYTWLAMTWLYAVALGFKIATRENF